MFGTLRFFLALVVVFGHLSGLYWLGTYSVFGFYCLSGFLMTLVMNKTYKFTLAGRLRFLANRILRIYPPYLAVVAGCVLLIALLGAEIANYHQSLKMPATISAWLKNIFIVGLDSRDAQSSRLVPPAWSIYVELCYYLAICVVLGKSRTISLLWLIASFSYTAYTIAAGWDFDARYLNILAGSLPFSLGACIYHFRQELSGLNVRWLPGLLVAAIILNIAAAQSLWRDTGLTPFYINLFLGASLIASMASRRPQQRWSQIDRFMGNLSYPMFLCHWHMGLIMFTLFPGLGTRGLDLVGAAVPPLIGVSWLIHSLVERQIEAVRARVRPADQPVADLSNEKYHLQPGGSR